MLNISEEIKDEYRQTSVRKHIKVEFPDLNVVVNPETVHSESMNLTEAIMDADSIEFVGCIPSKFSIQIQDFGENVKGEKIVASIYTDDTEEDPIPLFTGIVDTVTQQSNKRIKEIVAYDELYTKGNIDVAGWYIELMGSGDPITIKDFRDSLFEYIGIEQEETDLPNDDIEFKKQYSPVNMQALSIIQSLCQINGVFGIIDRYNVFRYRLLTPITQIETGEEVDYTRSLDYQEYTVKPVDILTIRQSSDDEGVSYGTGVGRYNQYIIQGNFFTLNLEEEVLQEMAENLYPNIQGIVYRPYESEQIGFPFIECGDIVTYQVYDFEASQRQHQDVYKPLTFYVFSRYLSGIQALKDKYEAKGEEYQTVFITDININIQTILQQVEQMVGQLQDYALAYTVFTNEREVVVGDGERKLIASTDFAMNRDNRILFLMEYLLDVETAESISNGVLTIGDVLAQVEYTFDDVLIDSRVPKQIYHDGKQVLSLMYTMHIQDLNTHRWKVYLRSTGGTITLPINQGLNILMAQGFNSGQIPWGGYIEVSDTVGRLTIVNVGVDSNVSDAVSIGLPSVIRLSGAEQNNGIAISEATAESTLTDVLAINQRLEKYVLTTSSTTTHNEDLVKTSAGKFEWQTAWTVYGTSQVIDSGYCTKVAVYKSGATVTGATIE